MCIISESAIEATEILTPHLRSGQVEIKLRVLCVPSG
jgi:hypothetical protein